MTTELSKEISEKEIRIEVEPEEPAEDLDPRSYDFITDDIAVDLMNTHLITPVLLALNVVYPDEYPDTLPELSLEAVEGEVTEQEVANLLDEMKTVVGCPVAYCCLFLV